MIYFACHRDNHGGKGCHTKALIGQHSSPLPYCNVDLENIAIFSTFQSSNIEKWGEGKGKLMCMHLQLLYKDNCGTVTYLALVIS